MVNRANGRLRLFRKEADFLAFYNVLLQAHRRHSIRLLGWRLMSNIGISSSGRRGINRINRGGSELWRGAGLRQSRLLAIALEFLARCVR